MTLEELDRILPNGFHDSEIKSIAIDYAESHVTIDISIWIATESTEIERYRDATLSITGLQFLTIEPPDPRYKFAANRRLRVDLAPGSSGQPLPAASAIPADCFAARFFVADWNSFIHVAARDTSLAWAGEAFDRSKDPTRDLPVVQESTAHPTRADWRALYRTLLVFASWVIAVCAGLQAASAAYVTYAIRDNRPILLEGAWMCAVALVALQGGALLTKGWKSRLAGVVATILLLCVLAEIFGRLKAIAANS